MTDMADTDTTTAAEVEMAQTQPSVDANTATARSHKQQQLRKRLSGFLSPAGKPLDNGHVVLVPPDGIPRPQSAAPVLGSGGGKQGGAAASSRHLFGMTSRVRAILSRRPLPTLHRKSSGHHHKDGDVENGGYGRAVDDDTVAHEECGEDECSDDASIKVLVPTLSIQPSSTGVSPRVTLEENLGKLDLRNDLGLGPEDVEDCATGRHVGCTHDTPTRVGRRDLMNHPAIRHFRATQQRARKSVSSEGTCGDDKSVPSKDSSNKSTAATYAPSEKETCTEKEDDDGRDPQPDKAVEPRRDDPARRVTIEYPPTRGWTALTATYTDLLSSLVTFARAPRGCSTDSMVWDPAARIIYALSPWASRPDTEFLSAMGLELFNLAELWAKPVVSERDDARADEKLAAAAAAVKEAVVHAAAQRSPTLVTPTSVPAPEMPATLAGSERDGGVGGSATLRFTCCCSDSTRQLRRSPASDATTPDSSAHGCGMQCCDSTADSRLLPTEVVAFLQRFNDAVCSRCSCSEPLRRYVASVVLDPARWTGQDGVFNICKPGDWSREDRAREAAQEKGTEASPKQPSSSDGVPAANCSTDETDSNGTTSGHDTEVARTRGSSTVPLADVVHGMGGFPRLTVCQTRGSPVDVCALQTERHFAPRQPSSSSASAVQGMFAPVGRGPPTAASQVSGEKDAKRRLGFLTFSVHDDGGDDEGDDDREDVDKGEDDDDASDTDRDSPCSRQWPQTERSRLCRHSNRSCSSGTQRQHQQQQQRSPTAAMEHEPSPSARTTAISTATCASASATTSRRRPVAPLTDPAAQAPQRDVYASQRAATKGQSDGLGLSGGAAATSSRSSRLPQPQPLVFPSSSSSSPAGPKPKLRAAGPAAFSINPSQSCLSLMSASSVGDSADKENETGGGLVAPSRHRENVPAFPF